MSASVKSDETVDAVEQGASPVPLRLRFRAWWDGRDLSAVVAEAAANAEPASDGEREDEPHPLDVAAEAAAPADEAEVPGGYWSRARIAIAEQLFGDGETRPGGSARTLDLIGSFGLSRDVNVLDIGAGLGGSARAIVQEHDAWVTGYEPDPALAIAAMDPKRVDIQVQAGGGGKTKAAPKVKLADKARVSQADLGHLELKPHVFNCALAREILHTVEDKVALLDAVFGGMKPNGNLMVTDCFLVAGKQNDAAVKQWIAAEPRALFPWTLEQGKKLLTETGFDLRVVEDVTARYRGDILAGFAGFVRAHEGRGIAAASVAPLLEAVELWSARLAAIDAGAIEVYKLVALRVDG